MPDLTLIPPAQWEIRSPGSLGLVGTDHITITLNLHGMGTYEVRYRGTAISRHAALADAKAASMVLPALLQDFGLEP